MKKIITFGIVLVMLITTFVNISAVNILDESHEHFEVVFNTVSAFTEEEQQVIAEHLEHNNSGITPFGILCLFGHNYKTESVTTITHCVRGTSPRCLKEYFTVSICTRCDKTLTERTSYGYITCCP